MNTRRPPCRLSRLKPQSKESVLPEDWVEQPRPRESRTRIGQRLDDMRRAVGQRSRLASTRLGARRCRGALRRVRDWVDRGRLLGWCALLVLVAWCLFMECF
jgi:hypothetical protein